MTKPTSAAQDFSKAAALVHYLLACLGQFDASYGFDEHHFDRHVLVAGFHVANLVHHVHAVQHRAENGVADAVRGLVFVQKRVINDVDEKLRGGMSGRSVRAMATVPRSFLRPLDDSLTIGGKVVFSCPLGVMPPPWTMKFLITRWKMVPS